MKKILIILLSLIICFSLAGCSCASKNNNSNPSSDREVGEEYPDAWG